jgi:hypothetical protein
MSWTVFEGGSPYTIQKGYYMSKIARSVCVFMCMQASKCVCVCVCVSVGARARTHARINFIKSLSCKVIFT